MICFKKTINDYKESVDENGQMKQCDQGYDFMLSLIYTMDNLTSLLIAKHLLKRLSML